MVDHTAELAAMRTRRDAITAERDLITDPVRIEGIDAELDSMDARLDELGVGDLPGDRGWSWRDGVVLCVDDERDHLLLAIRLDDGTRRTATMITDGEDDGTFETLLSMTGAPARLRLGRLGDDDRAHPATIDRSLPLVDVVSTARATFPAPSFLRQTGLR